MAAGISEEKLVTAGGSKFPEKPVWDGGVKTFGNRLYVLDRPEGSWRVLSKTLPQSLSNAATTHWKGNIYIVGGINETGVLRSAYLLRLNNGEPEISPMPTLPVANAFGAAVVTGQALYLAGGATTQSLTDHNNTYWRLPLSEDGKVAGMWERLADFPGEASFAPTMAADDNALYVFGGASLGDKGAISPSRQAYRYNIAASTWQKLTDMPEPRLASASPSFFTSKGEIAIIGGYGMIFSGKPKDHPGFEVETFLYSPRENSWRPGPSLPRQRKESPLPTTSAGVEPMIAAPAVLWDGNIVIIGGEVRPAVRTTNVLAIPLGRL